MKAHKPIEDEFTVIEHKYATKNCVSRVPMTRSQAKSTHDVADMCAHDTKGFDSILSAASAALDKMEHNHSFFNAFYDNGTDEEEDHFDIKDDEADQPSPAATVVLSNPSAAVDANAEEMEEEINIEDVYESPLSKRNNTSNSDIDITTISDEDDNNDLHLLRQQLIGSQKPHKNAHSRHTSTKKHHNNHNHNHKRHKKKKKSEKSRSSSPKRTKTIDRKEKEIEHSLKEKELQKQPTSPLPSLVSAEETVVIDSNNNNADVSEKQLPLKKRKWHTDLEMEAALVLGEQYFKCREQETNHNGFANPEKHQIFDAGFALVKLQEATQ